MLFTGRESIRAHSVKKVRCFTTKKSVQNWFRLTDTLKSEFSESLVNSEENTSVNREIRLSVQDVCIWHYRRSILLRNPCLHPDDKQ